MSASVIGSQALTDIEFQARTLAKNAIKERQIGSLANKAKNSQI